MNLGPLQIVAPILLLGVLAAAIPVLLHLLAKVRAPQVFFPTLRFLRMSMDKTARRRRVEHWLLLLLRMAALALLAIAVAQPLVRAASGHLGSDRDTAVVVILDNSLSMQAQSQGATRLEAARSAALQFLQERNFQQAALIVTNGAAGRTPPDTLIDRFKVIEQVRKVAPGAGRADLIAAVSAAQQLLATVNQPNKEIYLFSDLQRVSFRLPEKGTGPVSEKELGKGASPLFPASPLSPAADKGPLPSLLAITPAAQDGPGDTGPINLAVSEVAIDQPQMMAGQPIALDVTVRNFSRLAQKAMVRLFQDGRERADLFQMADLAAASDPGSKRRLSFALTFAEPGNHSGYVQVQRVNQAGAAAGDDLPDDDCRYFSLDLADRVNVLLVTQRHDMDASADAGYMLRRLMGVQTPGGPANPFRLTEITADQFDPALLANVQIAITSDVASFTVERAAAYREFAARGGTWMIWLGPSVDLANYNQSLGRPGAGGEPAVLGGELVRFEGAGTGGREADATPVFVQWVDEEHAMFRRIYPDLAAYRRLLVFRHTVLKRRSDEPGRVLARLSTDDPLAVETPIGRGRVLLLTTGACPRWTNWLNGGQAFAVYQMMLSAAAGGRGPANRQFGENELVTIDLPPRAIAGGATKPELSIQRPDQQIVTVPVPRAEQAGGGTSASATGQPAGWSARFAQGDQPGIYRWQLAGGDGTGGEGTRGTFAVNPPAEEADLAPITEKELVGLLPGRPVLVGHSLAELAGKIEQFRKGSPIWPYLLAFVLVLLAVEAKLANRNRPAGETTLRPAFNANK